MLLFCLTVLYAFLPNVLANVEKTIFLGPPAIAVPNAHRNLDDLYLLPLTPFHLTARTRLNASFPVKSAPRGEEAWMLLDGLSPGARYEVRICWLATAPTAFLIYTHTLDETFGNPELMSSLSAYASARMAQLHDLDVQQLVNRRPNTRGSVKMAETSSLFLQIFAAADYFTMNQTLMSDVPPVLVDVILDPYILNVFPKSLTSTAGYLIILAILGWFLAGLVWRLLLQVADEGASQAARDSEDTEKKDT